MKIKIYGTDEKTTELMSKVQASLDELGLKDFIKLEQTSLSQLQEWFRLLVLELFVL